MKTMHNKEMVQKFKDIMENGSGDVMIDFLIEHWDTMFDLMNAGVQAVEEPSEDPLECHGCGGLDEFSNPWTDEHDRLRVTCACGAETVLNDPAETGLPNSHFKDWQSPRIDHSEVPAHMREDGLVRARMEMMHDGDTDHEGGDLYSDSKNDEMPCPLCGKYDDFCMAWGECDGTGELEESEEQDPMREHH